MIQPLTTTRQAIWCAVAAVAVCSTTVSAGVPPTARGFLEAHCTDCHSGDGAEGGLDLTQLDDALSSRAVFEKWVRIHDRVAAGEMPPADYETLSNDERAPFLGSLKQSLVAAQRSEREEFGRVRGRRLTKLQVEATLHDLLGIDLPLASLLPEEPRTAGFTTVADGQPMSHFQMENHLKIVDVALDEAFRRALSPPDDEVRELSARELSRRRLNSRTREPEFIDETAVVWNGRVTFYGRLPATTARQDGWYRFTIRATGLNIPEEHGVWCTVRSGKCVSSAPLLNDVGAFEASESPREWTFETWLPKGHMLEVRPGDATMKVANFRGGQIGTGEGAPQNVVGVAIHSVTMERIHQGPDDDGVRNRLFGDLKIGTGKNPELVSKTPRADAERLMRRFVERAFRRPVDDAVLQPYIDGVDAALEEGATLLTALRAGYRAVLCSPRFLYFVEEPGPLDDYAVASRLSYFLWNSMPDERLLQLAAEGKLRNRQVLTREVERMLSAGRGAEFVENFAAEWLDLSEIDFTEPDRRLYPGFDLIVQQSMLDETQTFVDTMLDEDLSVTQLIEADYTYLNNRLARYYGIPGVEGDTLQRVSLQPDDPRGGLLTQGAILKVTANGSTTSPVIRGVWVSERLLGRHIPPPPESVPAIEPDIRGATTIREMLAKHRSQDSCASCHVKIDPPGFALENFDPSGRWRDNYLKVVNRRRQKGPVIDASYELPDGRRFDDLSGFQKMVLKNPDQLARNVVEKFLTYGTGAPVEFADRDEVDRIVAAARADNHGLRTLLQQVVASEIFLTK